jgi:hypothetical protein
MPVTITFDKPVNIQKLIKELAQAGFLQTSSRPGEFIVVEDTNNTTMVMAIYAAHDPNPTAAELAAIDRKIGAIAEARLATELKSLTPAQAVAYIETHVTTLATAKTVLKIMVRILIAMRDEIWPNLQDE